MSGRRYQKRVRAQLEEETRQRITEAAVALHGSVGPARTTISAIAEQAGVQRLTVYRHFPDEAAIFRACSQHWRAAHPSPDSSAWESAEPGRPRLEAALRAYYAFYRDAGGMLKLVLQDAPLVTALAPAAAAYDQRLATLRDGLLRDWVDSADGTRTSQERGTLVRAAIGHALHLNTWRSLAEEQELGDDAAVELMVRMVERAAELRADR
jgi:AcrR family transcriptional regulator